MEDALNSKRIINFLLWKEKIEIVEGLKIFFCEYTKSKSIIQYIDGLKDLRLGTN